MSRTIPTELFSLKVVCDDPRFGLFYVKVPTPFERPSLLGRENLGQDLSPGYGANRTHRHWVQAQLAAVWKPIEVQGAVQSYQDFPGINMRPAFSRRACDTLRDVLDHNGELLPLISDRGEYYLYNITKIVDPLDLKHTIFRTGFDPPCTDAGVDYFAFQEFKLQGLSIFRILECPTLAIVTDDFVRKVHEAGLNGFEFTKIWPFPREINWRDQASKRFKWKDEQVQRLKQNVLVLMLPLSGKKPTAVENKRICQLELELEAQLLIPSLNAPIFGKYEGSETINQEHRLFIACPDVARLVTKLLPWLRTLDWGRQPRAIKRFGDLHDVDGREEVVDLS